MCIHLLLILYSPFAYRAFTVCLVCVHRLPSMRSSFAYRDFHRLLTVRSPFAYRGFKVLRPLLRPVRTRRLQNVQRSRTLRSLRAEQSFSFRSPFMFFFYLHCHSELKSVIKII